MLGVRVRCLIASRVAMSVRRENLRECVTHLQLAIDCSVHEGLTWVKTSILAGAFGARR